MFKPRRQKIRRLNLYRSSARFIWHRVSKLTSEVERSVRGAGERIRQTVLTWDGVIALPHRFGGIEYQLQKRELGHIHGDHMLDIPFPKKVRDELVATGMAEPQHILSDSGWISFCIREPADVERAMALLRRLFDLWSEKLNSANLK